MNVSSKNDSRTKQNVVFVKQPGWWFQFRFESFSSGFRRGCIIAIVSLIFSENQSGQFGTWFVIIHLITYWFLNWGEPSINQPTSEKRASMKLIKDCEHSQPPTSATANQLCCVDCSTWIITLHWCNLEKTPRVYLIRWPWHAFQNIWTPSVSVCVCLSPRNRLNPLVLMKLPMVMSHSFSMFFTIILWPGSSASSTMRHKPFSSWICQPLPSTLEQGVERPGLVLKKSSKNCWFKWVRNTSKHFVFMLHAFWDRKGIRKWLVNLITRF